MPRIYNSRNDPLDFCKKHFPAARTARRLYGNVGDGPDGRGNCYGYDEEHPAYENEDYKCIVCRKLLTEEDN